MAEPLWTHAELLTATGGRAAGAAFAATGVSIDTRTLEPGDLFVALAGERDGHDFAAAALERGAAGVLAARDVGGSAIIVPDTLVALEAMAAAARDRAPQARRGAVTGSVGKTSVTQLVRAGLTLAGKAHASVKSYNNHIGVPLTLARMPRDTERAVFEIGMNHAGEITPLSRLVAPAAVAVTNVETVHVENFADGEAGVAKAKAEIFEGLAPSGTAVLNADNRWCEHLRAEAERLGAQVRTFGVSERANARLMRTSATPDGLDVVARIDGEEVAYKLRQPAPHWGPMSLCALLMMRALDVDLATAIAAVTAFEPLEGRGASRQVRAAAGAFTLVDESYNASPVSVAAALAALGARPADGRRIAVLTDMLELGPDSSARHAALVRAIEAASVDLVFCAGPLMRSLWDALPESRRGRWAPTAVELAPCLVKAVRPGDVLMVKGSRDSKAKALAEALAALDQGEEVE